MIKILLDLTGGDHPEENLKAAELIKGKYDDLEVVTIDGSDAKEPATPEEKARRAGMSDSMYEAFLKLKTGEYDGLVSMGETRDLMIGVMNFIGLKEGVFRPVICPLLPKITGGLVGLCDSGAIMKVTPAHLLQYGKLGSEFVAKVTGIKNPRVALLNVGVEDDKGDELHKEAFKLLKAEPSINFVGNIEARDFQCGDYDLVVADGFSANVMIKAIEGINEILMNRLGKYIAQDDIDIMNYRNFAGAAVLGSNSLIIKVHGFGDRYAIKTALEQAYFAAKNK